MAEAPAADIRVVLLPWLPRLIGQNEVRQLTLHYSYQPGETVAGFLGRLAADRPVLGAELWDAERGGLKQPIEVAVNGSVLGIHHQLDSPLAPGDEILLLPQYQGG